MKYCKSCIQPDTRPNTKFVRNTICPACNYFSKLKEVDWNERAQILEGIIEKYKSNSSSKFDCIIGVSGGKDSVRQALFIRDKLKVNPLLVSLGYPPEQVTQRGVDNISNLIELGFDVVISNPAPQRWKHLIKESFQRFTNWAVSTELALFSSVPQIAMQYDIRLILWGENPGLQLGDLKTLGKNGFDGNNLRNMNTLKGGVPEWMIDLGYKKEHLNAYYYPNADLFDKHNLQIVYLGWFLGDWSLTNNGMYSIAEGLKIRKDHVSNTGDLRGLSSLDEDWVTLNQMIKYYKYGFGRVTDYCNEEIRIGNMTREEGIELASKYDDSCSNEYIESFCEYIEITPDKFWKQVRSSVNRELFEVKKTGEIVKKFEVGKGL
jgi:N-acetyl sugar amidotransferase